MPDDAERPDMGQWPTGRLLATAARLVERDWHAALAADGGPTHAGLVALHLLQSGPRAQADLARMARVEGQTMSRTIDRLEREGHVERRDDPGDRRRTLVASTDAGARAWQRGRDLEERVMPGVADPIALREQLLEIIRAASADRWR